MQYVPLLLFLAAVFGVIRLVDVIWRKLFPPHPITASGKSVRFGRKGGIMAIALLFLSFMGALFYFTQMTWLVRIACIVSFGMGAFLLVQNRSFVIYYDEEGFLYRDLGKKAKYYRYEDIAGQKSILSRSGVISSLYADGDELQLTSAMENLDKFLACAFSHWCEKTGVDPDTVEQNTALLTYFPQPK